MIRPDRGHCHCLRGQVLVDGQSSRGTAVVGWGLDSLRQACVHREGLPAQAQSPPVSEALWPRPCPHSISAIRPFRDTCARHQQGHSQAEGKDYSKPCFRLHPQVNSSPAACQGGPRPSRAHSLTPGLRGAPWPIPHLSLCGGEGLTSTRCCLTAVDTMAR